MHDLELELGHVADAVVSKIVALSESLVPIPTQVGFLLRSLLATAL